MSGSIVADGLRAAQGRHEDRLRGRAVRVLRRNRWAGLRGAPAAARASIWSRTRSPTSWRGRLVRPRQQPSRHLGSSPCTAARFVHVLAARPARGGRLLRRDGAAGGPHGKRLPRRVLGPCSTSPLLIWVVYKGFRLYARLCTETDNALVVLANTIDKRDRYTFEHSVRVADYAARDRREAWSPGR